jgi:glycosyltransferase involved in cell wall biosynthesis
MGVDERLFNEERYTQAEARQILGWSEEEQVIMAVLSCMLPEKRTELIIQAMLPILQERPHTRLALVGSDYDATKEGAAIRMRALVRPQELLAQVTMTGSQSHARIPLYLAAADIVVDARNVHNFSSALMEALAMSRPVVVSKFSQCQIATGSSHQHYRVFTGDEPAALQAEINTLLDDPQQQQLLSAAAGQWWAEQRDQFSLAGQTNQLIRLYDAVLTGRDAT